MQLAAQAQRSLDLLSRDLKAPIYENPEFVAAVRCLALRRHQLPVRVLLLDPAEAIHGGHRLFLLLQHLSSRCEVRGIPEDLPARVDAFLVVDSQGYVRRPLADNWSATADFHAPLEARRLEAEFQALWDRAEPHPRAAPTLPLRLDRSGLGGVFHPADEGPIGQTRLDALTRSDGRGIPQDGPIRDPGHQGIATGEGCQGAAGIEPLHRHGQTLPAMFQDPPHGEPQTAPQPHQGQTPPGQATSWGRRPQPQPSRCQAPQGQVQLRRHGGL